MFIVEPVENKEPVKPGMPIYRGVSKETYKRYLAEGIAPESPASINKNSPSEIISFLFRERAPQKHIRGLEQGRFISFSVQKRVSDFYATAEYRKSGYIAIARFPDDCEGITISQSKRPYMYICSDNTVWIDLRVLLSLDFENIAAHSRTVVDHELLLMQGTIRPEKIISVKPDDCDRTFSPWAKWGEKI